ncbi:MAG: AMP-binding protein, partial [Terriglobales bacterium]
MPRTELHADPAGVFLHGAILEACRRHPRAVALVDLSAERRVTNAEYGELVERLARGLVAAGLQPNQVLALYLANSWEFCAAFHAANLAGAVPTPLNPSYREREVRFQLEDSGAAFLITDGDLIHDVNLAGLPALRRVYTTRRPAPGTEAFSRLLEPTSVSLAQPAAGPEDLLAALPYSSGTTGLPKGVM